MKVIAKVIVQGHRLCENLKPYPGTVEHSSLTLYTLGLGAADSLESAGKRKTLRDEILPSFYIGCYSLDLCSCLQAHGLRTPPQIVLLF